MPQINIRWADNTAELRARLKEGIGTIDAMKASVDKTVQSLGGQGLFKAANNVTAAIIQMGGATKLTAAEQERANTLLQKAIEKYQVMGQTVPSAMLKIADATKKAADATGFMEQHAVGATDFMKKYAVAAEPAVGATNRLSSAAGGLSEQFGLVSTVFKAVAAASIVKTMTDAAFAALEYAASLEKMKAATDISFKGLQQLDNIATGSNTTLEALTGSVLDLQRKLASGDDSAVGAIRHLGFELDSFEKLKGDDQFMQISKALGAMTDESDRNLTAFRLFGKGYKEILSALTSDVDKLKDSVAIMSDAQIKHMAELETRWAQYKLTLRRVSLEAVETATTFKGLFSAAIGLPTEQKQIEDAATRWGAYWDAVRGRTPTAPDLPKAPGAPAIASVPFGKLGPAISTTAQANFEAQLGKDLSALTAEQKKAIDAAKKWADVMAELNAVGTDYRDIIDGIDGETVDAIRFYLEAGIAQNTLADAYGLTAVQIKAVASALADEAAAWEFVQKKQDVVMGDTTAALKQGAAGQPNFVKDWLARHVQNQQAMGQTGLGNTPLTLPPGLNSTVPGQFAKSMTDQLRPGLTTGFGDLFKTAVPQAMLQAFQGGGSPVKSIGSLIGSQLGTNLVSKVGGSITGLLGKTVGGAFNAILPGVGSLIGPGISALIGGIKKLFGGPSATELAGRDVKKQFQDSFGGFDNMLGTIAKAYEATGKTSEQARQDVERLMAAEKKGGDAVKAVVADIQKQFDLQKKAAEMLPQLLGQVTSGFNAIGKGLFADSLKAFDEFKKKSEQFKDDPERMSKEFQDGFAIPTQESLDRVGRLAVTAFHAAIAGGMSFTEALDAVGPGIDAVLQGMNEFGGLTASPEFWGLAHLREFTAGHQELMGSVDGVNQMMKGLHMIGLLTQADFTDLTGVALDAFKKMTDGGLSGTDAMRAMQPTLQAIWVMHHDNGLEIDDNTQKLLDQAETQGLVGEDMKDVNQQVLDVLKLIAKALGADIPDAAAKAAKGIHDNLDNINPQVNVDINYNDPGFDPGPANTASTGGLVTRYGIQHFAKGGFARLRPEYLDAGGFAGMQSLFPAQGTDTVHAMLTPGELILNQAQQGNVADGLGGGGGVVMNVDARGSFIADGPSFQRFLDDKVWKNYPDAMRRDVAGMRGVTKRVVT